MPIPALLLSMFMVKIKTLLLESIKKRTRKIWELVIKDSCSVMLLMNGILKPFIHTLMSLLIVFARRWLFKERMEKSHGWDQIANLRLLLNMKNYQEVLLNQSESTISWSPLNTLRKLRTKRLSQLLPRKLSTRLFQQRCLKIPRLLSTHLDALMLEAQLLMPVWPEEKSLLILMVDGAHMVEVLSQVKIIPRLIDQLLTMPDMLLNHWLPMVSHIEF